MFTETDLRDLLSFISPAPVLSVYLNSDPAVGNAETFKLQLRSMLKKIDLPQDLEEVERFFNHEYDWSGRGVAVFSSAPQQFFRAFSFALPLFNWVYVADRPSVKPLADLMEEYSGMGVVLVDKQSARLFHVHLGQIQEQEGISGEAVKHTKRGGASSVVGMRGGTAGKAQYESEVIDKNMKDSAEVAVRFFEEHHVRRILIGGQETSISAFRKQLPKAWQSLVMGTFASSMTSSPNEILLQTLKASKTDKEEREQRLVEEVVGKAENQVGAVVGLESTLDAINNRRVRHLVLDAEFHRPAYLCSECGMITLTPEKDCESCNKTTQRIPDASDFAVSAVLRNGGEVTIVPGNKALTQAGSIGALLRY